MKTENISKKTGAYVSPEIEVVEITVEKGFATSVSGSINQGSGQLNPAGFSTDPWENL